MFYFCEVKIHEKYLLRCIEIAKNALGTAAPNPMVGCVIEHQNRIIGEGYTSPYGGPHAEVNAINAVQDKSLLSSATLYVTLEPCSHYGKTPPCAEFIIKHNIPRVVIGLKDPNSLVAGKGIELLRNHGCEVHLGVLEKACRLHHKRFLCFHQKRRPYVILKWAQTQDGFIAPEKAKRSGTPKPYWITSSNSRQLVHKWRSEEQGILVGTNTVLEDDPSLNTRNWHGRSPLRVVLDKQLKIPPTAKVFAGNDNTLIITEKKAAENSKANVQYEVLAPSKFNPSIILSILWKKQINSVIVEGGKAVLDSFISAGLWDEARIFTGIGVFGNGLPAPEIEGKTIEELVVGNDELKIITHD